LTKRWVIHILCKLVYLNRYKEGGVMAVRVAVNGFGRIGRLVVRAAVGDENFDFVALNDITNPEMLAHLFKYDSVHGKFEGDCIVDGDELVINKDRVKVFAERDPAKLPWADLEVDVVVESTGLFRDRESASKHIDAGAKKVIISAPAKKPDVTIVLGVNEQAYNNDHHHIISNASCTTNCLAPVAKVMLQEFGIIKGLMTTIHSYTNDQKILDLPHKDFRRARAAALSMIPTTTGAARAVSLVLPELEGKLDGMAIRVPTPNVSVVDFVAEVEREVTEEEVNEAMKKAADSSLKNYLLYSEEPLVSTDYVGCPYSSIVDAPSTKVIGGKLVKVLSWYDNEYGYACRIKDLVNYIY
jgi:glyceraldehyde 3-phosphate dehydrogenase